MKSKEKRASSALRLLGICIATLVADIAAAPAHSADAASRLRHCMAALASELPTPVSSTLWRIDGADRQLLALRSYLRNRDSLTTRWSWSEAQIADYQRSAEHRAAQQELAKIAARFAQSNPGYSLYVNPQVRSLDLQVRRWNENESVAAAARALEKRATRALARNSCGKPGDSTEDSLRALLTSWYPPRAPTLAAPGLSKHGQARAFDFQVRRGERIVAGTDTSRSVSAWDRHGWTRKLRVAVTAASDKFSGPLQAPYEPWHYEYHP